MAGMDKLRRLQVWTAARTIARLSYRATRRGWGREHWGLADQIRRAATSIPANLAEGYGLGTRPQFIRCTRMALASAYELQTHLEMVRDEALLPAAVQEELEHASSRSVALLIGFLKSLEKPRR
jgi:four helix bundle protein